jgi:VIT1/CCC1 family predicted Fe2+/Mn2+ transporter
MKRRRHKEHHRTSRVGWLRASVLGANDGIISTAALILGVAAAGSSHDAIVISGIAALVGGAMSMAAGEYVSVRSQADAEEADLTKEQQELREEPEAELRELAGIYVKRGLEPALAKQVAVQLTRHDALGAHARDELGLTEELAARPLQAALSSAASFTVGAGLPLCVVALFADYSLVPLVAGSSLAFLALLGAVAARAGGASPLRGALRVVLAGTFAFAITAGVGRMFGTLVV